MRIRGKCKGAGFYGRNASDPLACLPGYMGVMRAFAIFITVSSTAIARTVPSNAAYIAPSGVFYGELTLQSREQVSGLLHGMINRSPFPKEPQPGGDRVHARFRVQYECLVGYRSSSCREWRDNAFSGSFRTRNRSVFSNLGAGIVAAPPQTKRDKYLWVKLYHRARRHMSCCASTMRTNR